MPAIGRDGSAWREKSLGAYTAKGGPPPQRRKKKDFRWVDILTAACVKTETRAGGAGSARVLSRRTHVAEPAPRKVSTFSTAKIQIDSP